MNFIKNKIKFKEMEFHILFLGWWQINPKVTETRFPSVLFSLLNLAQIPMVGNRAVHCWTVHLWMVRHYVKFIAIALWETPMKRVLLRTVQE